MFASPLHINFNLILPAIIIIAIIIIVMKLKKKTKREYLDRTTKKYKRWHK